MHGFRSILVYVIKCRNIRSYHYVVVLFKFAQESAICRFSVVDSSMKSWWEVLRFMSIVLTCMSITDFNYYTKVQNAWRVVGF